MPRYAAFLSYSRKDSEYVEQYKNCLEDDGLQIWFDKSQISGGDLWELEIRRALTQSNCLVVFVTKNVMEGYAAREIEIARDLRKPIIPIVLDDAIDTDHTGLSLLRKYSYLDARFDQKSVLLTLPDEVRKRNSAPVIATYNVKGGVGKTTITMNLGMYYYKQRQKRVLLIDLDAQTNLSTALILPKIEKIGGGLFGLGKEQKVINRLESLQQMEISARKLLQDSYQLSEELEEDFDISKYIHCIEGKTNGPTLDIVAGDAKLHVFATQDQKYTAPTQKGFSRFIGQCRSQYDLILLDMGPSVNHLSLCALASSTHVLSPVTPSIFAMQGLNLLDEISPTDDKTSAGREHIILINAIRKEGLDKIRRAFEKSRFKNSLLESELASSSYFQNRPSEKINASLSFLPAYGNWGASPNKARQSLQNVATEIANRVGLQL